jgi:hypothetical protein
LLKLKELKRDRRERLTIDALKNLQSKEFAELIHYITTANFPNGYEQWQKLPKDDRVSFIQLMQQMEALIGAQL